eukprot:6512905-Alexandrium_andersonii.AAC.1
MGLGLAGLDQRDEPILVARLLKLPAPEIYTMAHAPVVLAKQMVWAMIEETWTVPGGEPNGRPSRPGA